MSRPIPPPPKGFTVIPPPPAGFQLVGAEAPAPAKDNSAILAAQKAKFPSSQEMRMGGSGVDRTREESAGQVARQGLANTLIGGVDLLKGLPASAVAMFEALGAAGRGDPRKLLELTGGAAKSTAEPFIKSAQGAAELYRDPDNYTAEELKSLPDVRPETFEGAQQSAGAQLAALTAAPKLTEGAVEGIGAAAKLPGVVQKSAAASAIGDRLIQSWMPVKKASLDFGRDPVAAVRQLPVAGTRTGMLKNIEEALGTPAGGAEGELLKAVKRREEVAAAEGLDDGMDIAQTLRDSVADDIARAERKGQKGIANQIRKIVESRIDALSKKYGGTWLKPSEIFAEKRILADDVNFKGTDTATVNANTALQSMYRGLDGAFDTLLPEVSKINEFYSSLLEAKKLVSEQIRTTKNSPIAHETLFGTLKSKFPETALKTAINKVVTGKGQMPQAGASALEFGKKPVPPVDQFANPSGVAPPSISGATEAKPAVDPYKTYPTKGSAEVPKTGSDLTFLRVERDPITGKAARYIYQDATGKQISVTLPKGKTP